MMGSGKPSTKEFYNKTRLCKFFAVGRCLKGKDCSFAHGVAEIKPLPDFYRTRLCPQLLRTGSCSNGEACGYAHTDVDLRMSQLQPQRDVAVPMPSDTRQSLQQEFLEADWQRHGLEGWRVPPVPRPVPQVPWNMIEGSGMPGLPYPTSQQSPAELDPRQALVSLLMETNMAGAPSTPPRTLLQPGAGADADANSLMKRAQDLNAFVTRRNPIGNAVAGNQLGPWRGDAYSEFVATGGMMHFSGASAETAPVSREADAVASPLTAPVRVPLPTKFQLSHRPAHEAQTFFDEHHQQHKLRPVDNVPTEPLGLGFDWDDDDLQDSVAPRGMPLPPPWPRGVDSSSGSAVGPSLAAMNGASATRESHLRAKPDGAGLYGGARQGAGGIPIDPAHSDGLEVIPLPTMLTFQERASTSLPSGPITEEGAHWSL